MHVLFLLNVERSESGWVLHNAYVFNFIFLYANVLCVVVCCMLYCFCISCCYYCFMLVLLLLLNFIEYFFSLSFFAFFFYQKFIIAIFFSACFFSSFLCTLLNFQYNGNKARGGKSLKRMNSLNWNYYHSNLTVLKSKE